MPHLDRWIVGFLVGVAAIFGLFMASRATDDVMYVTGLLVFIVGVLFIYGQIARVFGHKQKKSEP